MNGTSTIAEPIRLAQYRREMQDRTLKELWDYWETLRAGRSAPMRREIDPQGLGAALDTAFILERTGPAEVRFRLAGLSLCELLGMELRGMPADALIAPPDRETFATALARVFDDGRVLQLGMRSDIAGAPPITANALILPLRDDFGQLNRALGAMVLKGPLMAAPRRFALTATRHTRVVTTATDAPEAELPSGPADTGTPAPGLREAPAAWNGPAGPRTGRPRTRPHLRLVAAAGKRIDDDTDNHGTSNDTGDDGQAG